MEGVSIFPRTTRIWRRWGFRSDCSERVMSCDAVPELVLNYCALR